ncbi:YraN family protein [Patescibacteria group bacterium]|nr:YraN family protein [Patescibacteria group bacterium]
MDSKEIGDLGEKIARTYLLKNKYKILTLNFKRKWISGKGEIDIVGKKDSRVIFFEVKTRVDSGEQEKEFFPEDEISFKKQKQLCKLTQIYFSENKISLLTAHQIDILAIELYFDSKKAKIRHYKNVIEDVYPAV